MSPNQPVIAEAIEQEYGDEPRGDEYVVEQHEEYEEAQQAWAVPNLRKAQKAQIHDEDYDDDDFFEAATTDQTRQHDVQEEIIADNQVLAEADNEEEDEMTEEAGENQSTEEEEEIIEAHNEQEDIGEEEDNDVQEVPAAEDQDNNNASPNPLENLSDIDDINSDESSDESESKEGDEDADIDTEEETSDGEEVVNHDLDHKGNNPGSLPNVGARIAFKNPDSDEIIRATVVPMHRTMQYQWPGWRNIRIDGERRLSSVNMDIVSHGCVAWKYLHSTPIPRNPGQGYIPQMDGNYTLPSGSSHQSSYQYYSDIDAFTSDEISAESVHQALFGLTRTFFNPPVRQEDPQQVHTQQQQGRFSRVLSIVSRVCRQVSQPFKRH